MWVENEIFFISRITQLKFLIQSLVETNLLFLPETEIF